MKPKAVGYVRVSTTEQVAGTGLEVQEDAIRQWAKDEGYRLVDVLTDEGVSGSNGFDTRQGLGEALARLEAGDAEALVVYRLDRLARDLVVQETTVTRLAEQGCQVVSVTEPELNGDDATRVLVRQVLGAISQYERAVIRARMAAGKAAKRRAGGYVGGRPAFGWQAVDGELVEDPDEQETLTRARQLRAEGRSLREVGTALTAEGRMPRSGEWHPTMVARLLDDGG